MKTNKKKRKKKMNERGGIRLKREKRGMKNDLGLILQNDYYLFCLDQTILNGEYIRKYRMQSI